MSSIIIFEFIIPLLAILTAAFIIGSVYYLINTNKKKTFLDKTKPFDQLAGRKKEIRRLVGQILTGQSSIIVGILSQDRANILAHLSDSNNSEKLYGKQGGRLIFSWLNIQDLFLKHPNCQLEEFWQQALSPVKSDKSLGFESSTNKIYQTCLENQFDYSCLEKLVIQMKQENWRLVLILDRFDELLGSSLDQPEFFLTVRHLASFRSPSPLSLIISGEISLQQFHEKTKSIELKGSPYLNFIESGQVFLGELSEAEVNQLLAEMAFSKKEQQFIQEIAGRHPHFLNLAASALQIAKKAQEEQLFAVAKQDFYARIENILMEIIQAWDSEFRQAIIALVKNNKPLDFFCFETKIVTLEKQGFLVKSDQEQWRVSPQVLADFIQNKTEQELCNR